MSSLNGDTAAPPPRSSDWSPQATEPPRLHRAAGPLSPRRRARLVATASAFVLVDVLVKLWAEAALPGAPLSLGPVELRLGYNPGVAFGLGAGAPTGVVLGVTALVTLAIVVYAWRQVAELGAVGVVAVGAVIGGALGNLVDRVPDGRVTDYLDTGLWPTSNLADGFIVLGVAVVALALARR